MNNDLIFFDFVKETRCAFEMSMKINFLLYYTIFNTFLLFEGIRFENNPIVVSPRHNSIIIITFITYLTAVATHSYLRPPSRRLLSIIYKTHFNVYTAVGRYIIIIKCPQKNSFLAQLIILIFIYNAI